MYEAYSQVKKTHWALGSAPPPVHVIYGYGIA